MKVFLKDRDEVFTIKAGDKIQLFWYGDQYIPKSLSYSCAKVVRVKRTGALEVEPFSDSTIRTAHYQHVFAVGIDGVKVKVDKEKGK